MVTQPSLREQTTSARGGDKPGILLVEDQPQLRELMASLLSASDYRVFAVETATEALEVWEKHRETIALLFTDIVLPDQMSGIELAENLAHECPDLPIVVTSGYRLDSISNGKKISELGRFIPKPYFPREVLRLFREILSK